VIHALTFAAFAVTLEGRTVLPRARAAVVDGHVLLPVRALGNALGADVAYDGRAHTITVQRGAHVATIATSGAVLIANGKAYAPLRAVAETFGLAVGYDARSRTIALQSPPLPAAPVVQADTPPPGAYAPPATFTVSLQPVQGADVHDPYPAISARFAGAVAIDPRSVRVLVDGQDVTPEAAVIGDQVLYTPRRALAPGRHDVAVSAHDASGTPLAQQWSFNDSFSFAIAPAPAPFPISAIWIDRWVAPGTNVFDVYVEGAPGITGYVGVDGIGGFFPLIVQGATTYVAHVTIPPGLYQPDARVAARITLPNGQLQTIVLPQRITLFTKPLVNGNPYASPSPVPRPIAIPTRRSVAVPTPTPTPVATPRAPLRVPLQFRTPPPPTAVPSARPSPPPSPSPSPSPVRTRKPLVRRTLPPSPAPQ
jgi:hypothetical protein